MLRIVGLATEAKSNCILVPLAESVLHRVQAICIVVVVVFEAVQGPGPLALFVKDEVRHAKINYDNRHNVDVVLAIKIDESAGLPDDEVFDCKGRFDFRFESKRDSVWLI